MKYISEKEKKLEIALNKLKKLNLIDDESQKNHNCETCGQSFDDLRGLCKHNELIHGYSNSAMKILKESLKKSNADIEIESVHEGHVKFIKSKDKSEKSDKKEIECDPLQIDSHQLNDHVLDNVKREKKFQM